MRAKKKWGEEGAGKSRRQKPGTREAPQGGGDGGLRSAVRAFCLALRREAVHGACVSHVFPAEAKISRGGERRVLCSPNGQQDGGRKPEYQT